MPFRTRLLTLAALALIAFAVLFNRYEGDEFITPLFTSSIETPDFYIRQFQAAAMNEVGQIDYRVSGAYLEHLPKSKTTRFRTSTFIIASPPGAPWTVETDSGFYVDNEDLVVLNDSVLFSRASSLFNQEVRVNTQDATLHPKRKTMQTDAYTEIEGPDSKLTGTGLFGDLGNERLQLKNKVKATHEITD